MLSLSPDATVCFPQKWNSMSLAPVQDVPACYLLPWFPGSGIEIRWPHPDSRLSLVISLGSHPGSFHCAPRALKGLVILYHNSQSSVFLASLQDAIFMTAKMRSIPIISSYTLNLLSYLLRGWINELVWERRSITLQDRFILWFFFPDPNKCHIPKPDIQQWCSLK